MEINESGLSERVSSALIRDRFNMGSEKLPAIRGRY